MRTILATLVFVMTSGCSSFRTTAIDRCENDVLVVNPTEQLCGIPVMLRIPTHLELSVIETTYWEKKVLTGDRPTMVPLKTSRPTRTVLHKVRETEKIFVVDPMRPAAGTQNYGFEFQSSAAAAAGKTPDPQGKGYLKKLTYKIDDQTITETAKLLANSINMVQALQTSVNNPQRNSSDLIATDRTVAFARFDINSPSYEADVANFLNTYLNHCPSADCPTPTDVALVPEPNQPSRAP